MNETSAVIYVRLSLDQHGTGLAVKRQEDECRAYCERQGWTIRKVYKDNDISATTGKVRPAFEAMLAEVKPPEVIVTWHYDRLVRLTRELQRVIETKVLVHSVVSGIYDLSTPGGRATAMTITTWAQYEGEQKAERQRSAARQRAADGRKWWPVRPFGLNMNGTLHDREGQALQDCYTQVLAGGTLVSLARGLNEAGLLTPRGNKWTAATLRPVLLNARNAGIRVYNGEEIGKAQWEAVVPEETYRRAVQLLRDPARSTNGGGGGRGHRKALLTGFAVCDECGATVSVKYRYSKVTQERTRIYECRNHCLTAHADWVDERVVAALVVRLQDGKLAGHLSAQEDARDHQVSLRYKLVELRAQAETYMGLLEAKALTVAQFATLNTRNNEAIAEIERELASIGVDEVLKPLLAIDDLTAYMATIDVNQANVIVATFFERIVLKRRGKGISVMRPHDLEMYLPGEVEPLTF